MNIIIAQFVSLTNQYWQTILFAPEDYCHIYNEEQAKTKASSQTKATVAKEEGNEEDEEEDEEGNEEVGDDQSDGTCSPKNADQQE